MGLMPLFLHESREQYLGTSRGQRRGGQGERTGFNSVVRCVAPSLPSLGRAHSTPLLNNLCLFDEIIEGRRRCLIGGLRGWISPSDKEAPERHTHFSQLNFTATLPIYSFL